MSRATAFARVPVAAGGASYDVLVGRRASADLPRLLEERVGAHRYAFISDERVAELHGARLLERCREAGLRGDLHTFPEGERSKTRAEWARLTDALLDAGHGRDSCVVAIGGGVTGDLAGFVAATYMRGVPVVQVPTSYLAMIDASVGGKTGIDVPGGKNLVGAFHAPALVLADPELLGTLPRSERAQGLVEAFKHGAIMDAAYLGDLATSTDALLEAEPERAQAVVLRSVELKAEVVAADEREHGRREILNFGHTFGHALETASGYEIGHGSAVAIGMVLEAELGERLGVSEPGTRRALERSLAALALPASGRVDPETVLDGLGRDKKVRGGRPRWVLLARPGAVAREGGGWSREVPDALVEEVVRELV